MTDIPTRVEKEPRLIKRLLIVSQPKVGKTHALTLLPNNYVLNYDDSLAHFGAKGVNMMSYAAEQGVHPIIATKMIAKGLNQMKKENGGVCPYDFITLDTITEIEALCESYAKQKYQKTPQGEDFKGNLLTDLEYGAGYLKLRDAVNEILRVFWNLPAKTLIICGHLRESSVKARGSTVAAVDIGLTGKLKQIVSQKCDAIGTLYRSPDNDKTNILSFVTRTNDLVTGARPEHLRGKEFELSHLEDDDSLIVNWEQIFPDLKS